MNVLVVNIGSTSFKFRLFDMAEERVLAQGGVEGVGRPESAVTLRIGDKPPAVTHQPVPDQAAAVAICTGGLPCRVDAVGFKAVHGGSIADPTPVTADVLRVMEEFADAVPAHNPPYIAAMRAFQAKMPETPLVAAFETGFHQTIPPTRTTFAVPQKWRTQFGVRRYGFHGASHRYIAVRTAELLGRQDLRVISCHLGGSSSICAIRDGRSVANSFGMTPQSGLPQNNRVGDFDPYAMLLVRARTGMDLDAMLAAMAGEGGLLGISGLTNDMQKLVEAAQAGHEGAQLALGVFAENVRHYIGAYLLALGGLDVLVFTGGIGERSPEVRRRVCAGLEFVGIRLDPARNETGGAEATVSADGAPVRILAMQTNEELIVARQTKQVLATR
ncbi:MAG: acetate/propionate family kinase [Phycisphaerae bacterium]|nr:acetate/propionate family kinase [Phycisphaerae bacterium]